MLLTRKIIKFKMSALRFIGTGRTVVRIGCMSCMSYIMYEYIKFKNHKRLMKHFYTATDALSIDEPQNAAIQRYKDSNIYDVYKNDYDVDKNRRNKKEVAAMYLKKMKKMKNKKLSKETGDNLNKLWIYYDSHVRHILENNAYIWSFTFSLTELGLSRKPAVFEVLGNDCEHMTTLLYIMLEHCNTINEKDEKDERIDNIIYNYEMLCRYIDHIPQCKKRTMTATEINSLVRR